MEGILYVVFNKWINDPETQKTPYKIGITKGSVDDRYYGLGLIMPGKFETLFAYKFDDCSTAEKTIHNILNKKRLKGEWFNIDENNLAHIEKTCELMGGILVTEEVENEIELETEEAMEVSIESKKGIIKREDLLGSKEIIGITAKDILEMEKGDSILNISELIINSKQPNSKNWAGEGYKINGTPMKGINWIGNEIKTMAVIVRATGKYEDVDGKILYFEAKKGKVDKTIKTNQVIINQKKYKYPLLYFVKYGKKYTLIGKYSVDKIFDEYVTLIPFENN